jgi:hypothetical protein
MRAACLAKVWDLFTESRSQIYLMILFLHENVADLSRHSELTYSFALTNPLPIVANRFILIVEIVAKHVVGILRSLDRFGVTIGILPR